VTTKKETDNKKTEETGKKCICNVI